MTAGQSSCAFCLSSAAAPDNTVRAPGDYTVYSQPIDVRLKKTIKTARLDQKAVRPGRVGSGRVGSGRLGSGRVGWGQRGTDQASIFGSREQSVIGKTHT